MATELKIPIVLQLVGYDKVKAVLGQLQKQLGGTEVVLDPELPPDVETEVAREFGKLGEHGAKSFQDSFYHLMNAQMLFHSLTEVAEVIEKFTEGVTETKHSMAELSALTGVVGEDLERFKEYAVELGLKFGTEVPEQLETFKMIISRFGVEFGQDSKAVKEFAESVNILAKASGLDAVSSMDALSTAILQMGIDLNDHKAVVKNAAEMMNIMGEAARQGAAEIPQIASALTVAGVAAKGANISFAELNSAIEVLAQGGFYGSEAGTALRNIITRLQARLTSERGIIQDLLQKMQLNGDELVKTLTTKGLGEALAMLRDGMQRLSSDAERNVALIRMFGEEGQQGAGILLRNVDLLRQWTTVLEGTNTAEEQARIMMNAEAVGRFTNKLKIYMEEVAEFIPKPFVFASRALVGALPVMQSFVSLSIIAKTEMVQSVAHMATALLSKFVPSVVTAQVASAGLGASIRALAVSAWTALGPYALLIGAIGAVAVAGVALYNILHKTAEEKKEEAEATLQATQEEIKYNEEQQKTIENKIKLAEQWEQLGRKQNKTAEEQKAFEELNVKMIETYGSLVSGAGSFEQAVANVNKEIAKQKGELEKLTEKEYELKRREAIEKVEVTKAQVEVSAEKAKEEIDDIRNDINFKLSGIRMQKLEDSLMEAVDKMKDSANIEELQERFGEAVDLAKKIEDPEVRLRVMKALRTLFEDKTKAFKESEEQEKMIFEVTWQSMISKAEGTKIKFGGVEFDYTNAEQLDQLAGKIAEKQNINKDLAKQWLQVEVDKLNAMKEQKKQQDDLFGQMKKNVEEQKEQTIKRLNNLKYELDTYERLKKEGKGEEKGLMTEDEYKAKKAEYETLLKSTKSIKAQLEYTEKLQKTHEGLFKTEEKHTKTKAEIQKAEVEKLNKEFQTKKEIIELDKKMKLMSAENLSDEEKRIMQAIIERDAVRQTIETYKQVYGIEGEVNNLSVKKVKSEEEATKVKSAYIDLLKQQQQIENSLAEKPKTYEEQIRTQINYITLKMKYGDIPVSEGKEKIDKLNKELKEYLQSRKVELEMQLQSSLVIPEMKPLLQKQLEGVMQELARISEEEQRLLQEATQKKLELEKAYTTKYLEELEKRQKAEQEALDKTIQRQEKIFEIQNKQKTDTAIKDLERKKEAEIITEEHYQNEQKRLQENFEKEMQLMQLVGQAMREEAQRQHEATKLQIQMESYQRQIDIIKEKYADSNMEMTEEDKKQLEELSKNLAETQKLYEQKTDLVSAFGDKIASGVQAITEGLLTGQKEVYAGTAKELASQMIAIIKMAATKTITQLILGQLGLAGEVSGLAALLFVPMIKATVTTAVNALINPIIKELAHFATGGRVDKESVIVAGEYETEWIVRDQDIERLMTEVIMRNNVYLQQMLAEQQLLQIQNTEKQVQLVEIQKEIVTNKFDELKNLVLNIKPTITAQTEVKVDMDGVVNEIRSLRDEMQRWSGRVYVVAEDMEKELQRIQARKLKLYS